MSIPHGLRVSHTEWSKGRCCQSEGPELIVSPHGVTTIEPVGWWSSGSRVRKLRSGRGRDSIRAYRESVVSSGVSTNHSSTLNRPGRLGCCCFSDGDDSSLFPVDPRDTATGDPTGSPVSRYGDILATKGRTSMRVHSNGDPRDSIRPRNLRPPRDYILQDDLISIAKWLFALVLVSAAVVASMVALILLLAR